MSPEELCERVRVDIDAETEVVTLCLDGTGHVFSPGEDVRDSVDLLLRIAAAAQHAALELSLISREHRRGRRRHDPSPNGEGPHWLDVDAAGS